MNNGGLLITNQQGHLNNYGTVWYHPKATIKTLSMKNLNKENHIIYDSNNWDIFIVINTRSGGHGMIFTLKTYGLYYKNTRKNEGVSMFSTVEENWKHYTQWKYEREKTAREI